LFTRLTEHNTLTHTQERKATTYKHISNDDTGNRRETTAEKESHAHSYMRPVLLSHACFPHTEVQFKVEKNFSHHQCSLLSSSSAVCRLSTARAQGRERSIPFFLACSRHFACYFTSHSIHDCSKSKEQSFSSDPLLLLLLPLS
jgi:hypothetical protein